MSAQEVVEALIENAVEVSSGASDRATEFANAAQQAAFSIISLTPPPDATRPEVVIPAFDPTVDFTGDFNSGFNDAIADFIPDFQAEITSYINRFFPNNIGCLLTNIDGWICNTVANGGTGIPLGVENAIWQRDREREILEAQRAEDEAVRGYSARGWALPSGVLTDTLLRVREGLADKISASSRDRAIEQIKIEIENIRFAVEQGVKLRLGAIDALVNFLNARARLVEAAIEKAKALVDAKTRLFSSIGSYYTAIIGAAELVLSYEKLRIDTVLHQQDTVVQANVQNVNSRVNAAISAAEAMGAVAAAALSSQNSIAEISNATFQSGT